MASEQLESRAKKTSPVNDWQRKLVEGIALQWTVTELTVWLSPTGK